MEGEALFHLIATKLKAACDASDSEQSATVVSPPCLHWAQYQGKLCALQYRLGRLKEAKETIQQTLSRLPAADPHTQWTRGWGLFALGTLAYFKGEHARAKIHLPEAGELLKAQGDFWSYAWSLIAHSQSRRLIGDYERAQRLVEEAERILSTMGEQLVIGYVLSELGRLAAHRGELAQAETYHKAALVQRTKVGTRTGIVLTQSDLGLVNCLQGNYEAAQSYYLQSVATATEINMLGFVSDYLWKLGNLAVAKGDYTTAKHYFQESGHGVNRVGGPGWAALGLGEFAEAKQLFRVSLQAMRDSGAKPVGLDALVGMAHLQAQSGQFRQALECLTLVRHHPASDWEIKEKVRKLWEELVAELSPQLVSEAEARGREMDLYETAESLVAESGDT
jgi:tetratricopeptide (TPR) repeat protein